MYTEPTIPEYTHITEVYNWRKWIKYALSRAILQHVVTGTTVGAAGAGTALPATPEGYVTWAINGTKYKIPYYKV